MKMLADEIKNSWIARGKIKKFISRDEKVYKNYRRSIYVVKNIKKGEKFTTSNLKVIRPGFGLEPKYYEKILGKLANKNLSVGKPFKKIMAKI